MNTWTKSTLRWPGLPGTVRAERRLLPGGRAVAIRRSGVGWLWLAWTSLKRWNGVADTRAAAMTAALYAGEVC